MEIPNSILPYLPIIIFVLKTAEISINSIRVISTSKGFKNLAVLLAVFECGIWIGTLTTVFAYINNVYNILFYVAGFAFGNYIGIIIEKKLALGDVLVRIITQKDPKELLDNLRKNGYRVTELVAESNYGKNSILFAPIKRQSLKSYIKIVNEFNPNAFYTVEGIMQTSQKIEKPKSNQEKIAKEITKATAEATAEETVKS